MPKKTNKNVMIVFGANWCPNCIEFNSQLTSSPLKELVDKNYIVTKVNVGNFDENMDFVFLFDEPLSKGIPSIVITDSNKVVYFTSKAKELSSIRKMKKSDVIDFFEATTLKINNEINLKQH